jgi:hypothetical protein
VKRPNQTNPVFAFFLVGYVAAGFVVLYSTNGEAKGRTFEQKKEKYDNLPGPKKEAYATKNAQKAALKAGKSLHFFNQEGSHWVEKANLPKVTTEAQLQQLAQPAQQRAQEQKRERGRIERAGALAEREAANKQRENEISQLPPSQQKEARQRDMEDMDRRLR